MMMKSLYAKMAVIHFLLLTAGGCAVLAATFYAGARYQQEVNQHLNRDLAENLLGEQILITDGSVNRAALEHIFHTLMIVNPNIEVYLLDAAGNVLTYSATPGQVKSERVALEPIIAFLSGNVVLPILGDDPRHPGRQKVFSVAPVPSGGRPGGYLYVVLASEEFDTAAVALRRSYFLRLSSAWLLGIFAAVLVAGLVLFNAVTRRLRRLGEALAVFRRSDFSDLEPLRSAAGSSPRDEVGGLADAVLAMGRRIVAQLSELRRTDEVRRELIANVSHDLRTPLSVLQGYLETVILKDQELPPGERREYLAIACKQGERLGRLVSELFELARLEAKEMRADPETFNLAELACDVLQEFQLAASQRHVSVGVRVDDDLPLVGADISLIHRALQNLIGNAIRHTDSGGSVTISIERAGDDVGLGVEDTGCGIPPRDLERVFDRYHQVQGDTGAARPAGGLGLAIVRRIVELHGRTIEAQSVLGSGTRFSFSLERAASSFFSSSSRSVFPVAAAPGRGA
ncbi:MAG: sensor histidine kinase [Candidatus Schekmanbacteria bacterium]|nr:sensor histidine kinase [Candidatus Schekmanbacteria bacterium]